MKLGRLIGFVAIVAGAGLLLGCANQDKGCCGKCGGSGADAAKPADQRVSLAADTTASSGKAGGSCCSSAKTGSPAAGKASCAGKDPAKCAKSCGSARLAAGTASPSGCPSKAGASSAKGCGGEVAKPASACCKAKAASVQADASTK